MSTNFLRRESSSGPSLSHSQEHSWNPVPNSWATPTPRAEFNGARQETLSRYPTSPNDSFRVSGHGIQLELQMKELEARTHHFESAYKKEHEENIGLRAEIRALQYVIVIGCLQIVLYFSLSRSNFEQLLEAIRSSGMQDCSPPSATVLGSAAPAFADLSVRLSLDAALPTTKREEYPNVRFWTRLQWTEVNSKFKSETKVTGPIGSDAKPKKKSGYIETADGELLSEDQMSKIRLTMRSSFQHLKRLNLLPDTWTKICHVGRKLYLLTVCNAHPELTYCDSFWKAEQIAIDNFPSWHNNHVRVKKEPAEKQESVDMKLPSLKRSKSPPVANLSAKKARTEAELNDERHDNDMDDIYYEPEPTAEGNTQLDVDSDKAVVIDNPLYVRSMYSCTTDIFVDLPYSQRHEPP